MVRNREWGNDERMMYPVGNEAGEFVQFKSAQAVRDDVPDWDGTDTLTVPNTVVQLKQGLRLSHNYCRITVNGASIRFWLDGTVPTSTTGQLVSVNDVIILESADELQDIQFIRANGADATLSCSFGNR